MTEVPPSTLDEVFFSRSRLTWDAWVQMWDGVAEDSLGSRDAQVSRPRRNRRPQVSRIPETWRSPGCGSETRAATETLS